MSSERSNALSESTLLLALFAAMVFVVDPRGNFPLNDDWQFALSSWNIVDTGHFRISDYSGMSLRLHAYWGAAWSALFGKTFTVLRCSTLAAAAGALLVLRAILARVGVPRAGRIIAPLALLAHPIFFWSSFTFMTQVTYLFCALVAMYCFLRALDEKKALWIFAGCCAALASCFIRQTGIVNLVAIGGALVLWRERLLPRWKFALGIVVSTLATYGIVSRTTPWLTGSPAESKGLLKMWSEQTFRVPQALDLTWHYSWFTLVGGSLFLAPLLAAAVGGSRVRYRRALVLVPLFAIAFLWRAHELVSSGHPIPFWATPFWSDIFQGNILIDFGLGPPTLTDVWGRGFLYPHPLPMVLRQIATYVAAVGGALLFFFGMYVLSDQPPKTTKEIARWLCTVTMFAATAILCLSAYYCDRYVLDATWSAAILLATIIDWERVQNVLIAATLLLCVGFFSVFATQEYLRWNRARWASFAELRASGVPLEKIDGGYEINKFLGEGFVRRRKRMQGWALDDSYILAFHPLPGYRIIARRRVDSFLGIRSMEIVTLQKE